MVDVGGRSKLLRPPRKVSSPMAAIYSRSDMDGTCRSGRWCRSVISGRDGRALNRSNWPPSDE
jgi:hypothetical protein